MAFGPIDLVALEFKDNNFGGEVIAGMTDLVTGETIRIIDLVILMKDDKIKDAYGLLGDEIGHAGNNLSTKMIAPKLQRD